MAFSSASRGQFLPLQIEDNFNKDMEAAQTLYGFELNGKNYQQQLQMQGDWLDPLFIDLIGYALTDQAIDLGIYDCAKGDGTTGYVLLSRQQYDYLRVHQSELFEIYKE